MTAHARAALLTYPSNRMEGPTFQNNFQLGANFLYHLCALRLLNVHKVNPERISQACPKSFCSKFFVVAFVSSWANLKTNLGSYTPGNLQLQATVSSNISGFLARLQPLHLDHGYVVKGRSSISKSTFFIPEACSTLHFIITDLAYRKRPYTYKETFLLGLGKYSLRLQLFALSCFWFGRGAASVLWTSLLTDFPYEDDIENENL